MYSFFALVSRTKNIDRWALMRNTSRENVQEHSHMVAVLAHALACIERDVFGGEADPDKAASAALFHDVPEIITGDMPTPVKYHDDDMISAYKRIEKAAEADLIATLPEPMRETYCTAFSPDDRTDAFVRAADKLSAYIKCIEEMKSGNEEFRSAAASTLRKLHSMDMRSVEYFLDNFMPAFSMTLDELNI